MAQMWAALGIMATAFAAMIGFSYRAMTEQGKTLGAQIDGLRGEVNAQIGGLRGEVNARIEGLCSEVNARIDGLRSEVTAQFAGLRSEMNGRFDNLTARVEKVESIDREVHALSIKVKGREIPRES
jgi:hypothetical protein